MIAGIKPNAAYPDSGWPLLGEGPARWEVWQLGRFARVGDVFTPPRIKPGFCIDSIFPWLNSLHVKRGYIANTHLFISEAAFAVAPPLAKPT